MPKFTISASETVYYRFEVEAADLDDAKRAVWEGEYDIGDPIDGDNFEVHTIEEEPDELVAWYTDGVQQNKLKEINNA